MSDSPESKSTNTAAILFIAVILGIVGFFASMYIGMKLNYQAFFSWWKTYGGKQYDKLFSTNLYCAAKYSGLLYYVLKLLTPPINVLSMDAYRFLDKYIMPNNIHVDADGMTRGINSPRSISVSVLLDDSDPMMKEWLNKSQRDLTVHRTYTETAGSDGYYVYTATNNGVYPMYDAKTDDFSSWRGLIMEWLGEDWKMTLDDNQKFYPKYVGTGDASLDDWYVNKIGRADNFLARNFINSDCPLIKFFINNEYSEQGMVVDAIAFRNMLGQSSQTTTDAGGWAGFCLGMSNATTDQYAMLLYTQIDSPPKPTPPPCNKSKAAGNAALSGAMAALGIIAMAIPLGGWAAAGTVFAGLAMGGLSAGLSYSKACT